MKLKPINLKNAESVCITTPIGEKLVLKCVDGQVFLAYQDGIAKNEFIAATDMDWSGTL